MLNYQANVQAAGSKVQPVFAIAFAPSGKRLALANADNVIHLLDDHFERRDKIQAKGADKENRDFVIRGLEWSPDSSILAVAQSDNIIYSYKLGLEWGEKKAICSKIVTSSSVSCLAWPRNAPHELFFGQADGSIRMGFIKTHKSQVLYSTESYAVSLAVDRLGKTLASGHLDGQVYIYNVEGQSFRKLINAGCVPTGLSVGKQVIFTGSNGAVSFVDRTGSVAQRFDFSSRDGVRDLRGAFLSPAGDSLIVTAHSAFIVFSLNPKRQEWEEKGLLTPANYYVVTSGAWKPDGSKFIAGNMCGAADVFDVSIKKLSFKGRFELNYLSSSKIRITSTDGTTNSVVASNRGLEILNVNILKDRYVITETSSTLILGDLQRNKVSEVEWIRSGNEKFEFTAYDLCWVANAGEVSVVELGRDEIIGSFRTEYTSRRAISVVAKQQRNADPKQFVAFLLDSQTIRVLNLTSRLSEVTIDHDCKVSWLEFNPNASKLLFKDARKGLFLYNLVTREKMNLLSSCGFCCWIPDSDVIIAQSKTTLNIWYSSDAPDKKTTNSIRGNVMEVRSRPRLGVVVLEGNVETFIELDDLLMKFGFAIENKNIATCLAILQTKSASESEGHWRTLLNLAESENNYVVIERCLVALGDVPRAAYYHRLNRLIRRLQGQGVSKAEVDQHFEVRAMLAMLDGQFHVAESLFLQNGHPEKAIEMYQQVHRWDDSLRIAQETQRDDYQGLRESYFDWLLQTGQEEKAAELCESEGDSARALDLFIKARLPARAARIIIRSKGAVSEDMTKRVMKALQEAEMFEPLGELYEMLQEPKLAINLYIKAGAFERAREVTKGFAPEQIVAIEEKWGDYLMDQNQKEAAIFHYIEARASKKALEAAIACHQWQKAISLLASLSGEDAKTYSLAIAEQLAIGKQFELAEKYFVKAGSLEQVFKMYVEAKKIKEALRFAKENFSGDDLTQVCERQAKELERARKLEEAEKLYIELKRPELAIKMYKSLGEWDRMLWLFSIYRPESLREAHNWIGKKLEEEEQLGKAERHYLEGASWISVVDMYEKRRMFEDCLRICKSFATDRDTVERAKRWEAALGEEELSEMLKKAGLVDSLIDFLCEKKKFDEAFKLAERAKHKMADVHLAFAMNLEDERRYKEAEREYILAGKYDQVVNMYVDLEDFGAAVQIARQYDQSLLEEVYLKQARLAFEGGDLEKMEACFIAAKKPEMAVSTLVKLGHLSEALRVARKHCPQMVKDLNNILEKKTINVSSMSNDELLTQAAIWEQAREWSKAIDVYLECSEKRFPHLPELEAIWDKAVQLAYNYAQSRYIETVKIVCKRLRDLQSFGTAAEYYDAIQMFEEAAKCFIAANDFEKAKRCCSKIKDSNKQAEVRGLIEKNYKTYLRSKGDAETLVGNEEITEGLNLMIERGDWTQALAIAASKSPDLLAHYQQAFLNFAMDNAKFTEALKVLLKFEPQYSSGLIPLYHKLVDEVFALSEPAEISDLKLVLIKLVEKLGDGASKRPERDDFDTYLLVAHLIQMRQLYEQHGLTALKAKASVSLVRYADITTLDRPFYEAGLALREVDDETQAFMYLNRYLDIYYCIKDPEGSPLEDSDEFRKTDIPALRTLRMPAQNFISEDEQTKIRDWLLSVSHKKSKELHFRLKTCSNCSQSIYEHALTCPFCKFSNRPCIVTGLPLTGANPPSCNKCKSRFNAADLKTYLGYFSHCPWCSSSMK